ncbi:unnamed protein product [Hyaloperonospora brassicae]|uniref:Uncharacterized protein n=1 Tax=Hyaloperonospora brassicae TaxID=162125 RepID=A0AAV0TVL1_HYABA|nr:unnamed protein product [Hyaloperonospora brassicae]
MAADALTNKELDAVMNLESEGRLIDDVVDFLESDLDKGGQDEKVEKVEYCYAKFRELFIDPLAVAFSKFEEIMMMDADTTFFVMEKQLVYLPESDHTAYNNEAWHRHAAL